MLTFSELRLLVTLEDDKEEVAMEVERQAVAICSSFVGRVLESTALTEELRINGNKIIVNEYPLTAVASVVTAAGTDVEVESFLREGIITIKNKINTEVKVEYTAGFVTIPDDIKSAVAQTTIVMLQKFKSGSLGQRGKKFGDGYDISYEIGSLPLSAKEILKKYTRKY